MNIYPVNNAKGDSNRFCGPAAISILTGMTTGQAARLMREITGKTCVMGTHAHEVRRTLAACSVSMTSLGVKQDRIEDAKWSQGYRMENPTLAKWLRDNQTIRTPGRVFLLAAGHHWLIITGRRYCCGLTREIVSIKHEKVKRRARVTEVYEIKATGKITIPARATKPKTTVDPYRAELLKLEKACEFKGKVERDGSYTDYVVAPCEQFPRGFSTLHYNWCETLNRVELAMDDYEQWADEDGCMSM